MFTDHSSNGTLHESNQIITRIHQSSVVLKNGDTLTIGNILLEIELEPLNLSRRPAEKHSKKKKNFNFSSFLLLSSFFFLFSIFLLFKYDSPLIKFSIQLQMEEIFQSQKK